MSKETFEEALAQLEEVVKRMEDEAVGLEEALRLFERGYRVVDFLKAGPEGPANRYVLTRDLPAGR